MHLFMRGWAILPVLPKIKRIIHHTHTLAVAMAMVVMIVACVRVCMRGGGGTNTGRDKRCDDAENTK